jgi:hypothetical protein
MRLTRWHVPLFLTELWQEYRELTKSLVGTVAELIVLFVILKLGQGFIHFLNIEPSCSRADLIECAHTIVLISAWVGLLGSFIVVATIFAYRHTLKRIRDLHVLDEVKQVKEYGVAIVSALTSMEPTARDSDRIRAIHVLLEFRALNLTDRKITMFLGRLHKMRLDYDGAIECCSYFIDEKRRLNQIDKDYADVLYNRACYRALNSEKYYKAGKASDGDQQKQLTYGDLSQSIEMSAENTADARDDPDFNSLKTEEQFQRLIGG